MILKSSNIRVLGLVCLDGFQVLSADEIRQNYGGCGENHSQGVDDECFGWTIGVSLSVNTKRVNCVFSFENFVPAAGKEWKRYYEKKVHTPNRRKPFQLGR